MDIPTTRPRLFSRRCWVEVNLDRIRQNLARIRSRIGGERDVICVVKADAYGHGMVPVSEALVRAGARRFAVATVAEAIELREALRDAEILVLQGYSNDCREAFLSYQLTAAVFDDRPIAAGIRVHLKVDTGMTRLGIPWDRGRDIQRMAEGFGAALSGVFTHLACPGSDADFTRKQVRRFLRSVRGLSVTRHIASSYALNQREAYGDAVRPGLALYGFGPADLGLTPAMEWKARLLSSKRVKRGSSVGYDRTFTTTRAWTDVGIVAVGYADGYDRCFSNVGKMCIRGMLVPVIGRVSMDLTAVDLTGCVDAAVGDEVTILSSDANSPLSAAALATVAGTIPYEILTSVGPRVAKAHYASS